MGGRLSIMIASLAVCSAVGDTLPGTFLFDLGEATVTTLAERQQSLSKETLVGATDDMLQRYAPAGEVPNAINAFLVHTGGKRVLVDTGLGLKLEENLKSAGVSPVEIDAVLITHMHRDHIGGL
ncbi:MAG TPA: MBL fold metallo-hydrolase, partial [Kiritimatiellia bacterium]|nr:MBL fold metallo-hydrolase [Kiritimatiellia bacterium]